jgi:hypothetical protein
MQDSFTNEGQAMVNLPAVEGASLLRKVASPVRPDQSTG